MSEAPKQPARLPSDGAVGIVKVEDPEEILRGVHWYLIVTTRGVEQRVEIGEFNLFRLFAVIAQALGIPLSKAVQKSIRL